ncbi:MAG: chromosome segregation protein SMC [Micrococcales bacterium]|nr:chromosome segregation protein SMC [Micrococcales bacterium]
MYVKSLTLRGFKSFASATHLRLEPGITCIVGPNGSGKSNVVDALAWVMGEQGAKSLRGGKMEDVIFAGTSGRPPLGRAEVTMTIDNSDGALPIDYSEVTISRTMFRSGGSDYAINGTSCRLLDIQELLADSGIGREMHVIVGQGQLDAVLRATPQERRGFIEEAAGVLKHRKRKERALRKLETMETNLTRVADLTTEIRRQLGPLGRQAQTARKAAVIQADVRDARLRLLADDLGQLTSTLEQEVADETALLARRAEVESSLSAVRARLGEIEEVAGQAGARLAEAQDCAHALAGCRDRLRAVRELAAQRARLLAQDSGDAPQIERDPQELLAQAVEIAAQEASLAARVGADRATLREATQRRQGAESAANAERQRVQRAAAAAADRREGLATLAGKVAAKQSRIDAGEAEIGRLSDTIERARERARQAQAHFVALEGGVSADEEGEEGLDAAYESAQAQVEELTAQIEQHSGAERAALSRRDNDRTRRETLELSLRRKDGSELLLSGDATGILGSLPALLSVESGCEAAAAAALGWAADALVVTDLSAARGALARLRTGAAGRAGLILAQTNGPLPDAASRVVDLGVPAGCRAALDRVTAPAHLEAALQALLGDVVFADDEDAAALAASSGFIGVTPGGDVYGPGMVRGGSADAPSLIELTAAAEKAAAEETMAEHEAQRARFALERARAALLQANAMAEAALEDLHTSDARMAALGEELGQLSGQVRAARAEAERGEVAVERAQEALSADRQALAALTERLLAAQAVAQPGAQVEPRVDERDRLEAATTAARATKTEARLTVRTGEERLRAMTGRAAGLERQARAVQAAHERAQTTRMRRAAQTQVATQVQQAAQRAAFRVEAGVEIAVERRAALDAERVAQARALTCTRSQADALSGELAQLTDSVHRDEIARTQQRLRIEQLQTRAIEELGVAPEVLVDEFGPHLLVPPVPDPDVSEPGEPTPYEREAQEKRLRSAARKLAQLGRVNPLALEEFAALEERHNFLVAQLEDLRLSKKDLLDIVAEVDERVQRAFAQAYADTAEQFEGVFSRLFPGGEGRLTLTDPENMLTTGIEIEARPPGKKIKRLSLLSGGERSLTAVALLVSIFKARPSPFYIMDEVEAALDDTNLGRLITLFEDLRGSSQLIVITHQKRTMEVADALYGVTMRGDGVTTVVSQRIRDVLAAQPA